MQIEDLVFSFKGKIIAERNSSLASCTRAWYCQGAERNGRRNVHSALERCVMRRETGSRE